MIYHGKITFENGILTGIYSDNPSHVGTQFAIVNNDESDRIVVTRFDQSTYESIKKARGRERCHIIGTACEIASEALLEMSRTPHSKPVDQIDAITEIWRAFAKMLEKATV